MYESITPGLQLQTGQQNYGPISGLPQTGLSGLLQQSTIPCVHKTQEIKIQKVLNGFMVQVGCQTVVFEKKDQMLSELSRYYDNPQAVEKEYMEKFKSA